MMTQKERLVELLNNMPSVTDIMLDKSGNIIPNRLLDRPEDPADYLLSNGVIVPPCKVGDTVYIKRPFEVLCGYCTAVYFDNEGFELRVRVEKYSDIWVKSYNCFASYEEADQALKERDGK